MLVGLFSGTTPLEMGVGVSYKVKHDLYSDPAIPLLGIYPINTKTDVHNNVCVQESSEQIYSWKFKLEITHMSSTSEKMVV